MNKSPISLLTVVALLGAATLASAQRTWIVDAANGANADYTDLPAAVAAARHGDRILLRPGGYSPVTTGKGISILGSPGVTIWLSRDFEIKGIPAGKSFVLQGCQLVPSFFFRYPVKVLKISNCVGHVHLSGLTVGGGDVQTEVRSCKTVSFSGCTLSGKVSVGRQRLGWVWGRSSRVTFDSTVFEGYETFSMWLGRWSQPGALALETCDAVVTLSDCYMSGSIPMQTYRSDITLLSGSVLGGQLRRTGVPPKQLPGISANGGTLTVDPRATILGTPTGFSRVIKREMPLLTGRSSTKPNLATLSLSSRHSRMFAVYASLATQPLANTPDIWLDMRYLRLIDAGILGGAGWTKVVPLPSTPALQGLLIAFQEVELVGPSLQFSNPAFVIVGR